MLRTHRRAIRAVALVAGAGVALALVPGGAATAAPAQRGCENRTNATVQALLECVRAAGAMEHLEAFQEIADANGGTRAAGTEGYDESVEYVVDTLEAAGWEVELDEFDFVFVPPPTLTQTAPITADYETGVFTGTGYGTVTAAVTPVDIVTALPRDPVTSGCEDCGLRRLPGRQHRPHPARHVRVRCQGDQRPGGGCLSRDHLQPGEHPAPLRPGDRHAVRDQPDAPVDPRRRRQLRRRCRAFAARFAGAHRGRRPGIPSAGQRHRRASRGQRRQRRDGGRAPGLGPGRSGHQRQRQRFRRPARGRPEHVEEQAAEHGASRLVGCGGERPARFARLRDRAEPGGEGPHRAVPELRHGRLTELHLHGLRR